MRYEYLHPRDELVLTMQRIYRYKMTTTSGGNLSILDENGDMWITPTGVDKGTLTPNDIVCVRADGRIEGLHKPSSEYPFHKAIYAARRDLRSVVHAHPMALVAFSIAHKVPDTKLFHQAWRSNGAVAFAPYGTPGSEDLGVKIAQKFEEGFDSVILENHGVCCGGKTLQEAFQKFETLEVCCKILIKAHGLGEPKFLTDQQLQLQSKSDVPIDSFEYDPTMMTIREKDLRNQLCKFIERGYRQGLLTTTTGTFSAGSTVRIPDHAVPADRHSCCPRTGHDTQGQEGIRQAPQPAVFSHKAATTPSESRDHHRCPATRWRSASVTARRTYTIPES
jgi:L-fuculose-phosphate aldolase